MDDDISVAKVGFWIFVSIVGLTLLYAFFGCWYTVSPGTRGVVVTLGHADQEIKTPGFGLKAPFVSDVRTINVTQQNPSFPTVCFSSDLQQVTVQVAVSFHIEDAQAMAFFLHYNADLNALMAGVIGPRTEEALKQKTAVRTAENIVKDREGVKAEALAALREKVSGIVTIDDIVIQNVTLSPELESAIEQKMVQQQNADKSKFAQDQAKIEAETAAIVAEGQAKSIQIQGEALAKTPNLVQLKIVEKWNGVAPLYISGATGDAGMILTIKITPKP